MVIWSTQLPQVGQVGQIENADEHHRSIRKARDTARYLIQLFDNISTLVTMMDIGQDQSVQEILSNMSPQRTQVRNFANVLSQQLESE